MVEQTTPLIRMKSIHKSFGKVKALYNVDFEIGLNEVVGLVGDNGAGKSTLIKILSGVYNPDRGDIYIEDTKVKLRSPGDALNLGIETIHQHAALVEGMDIKRNVFIGRELTKWYGFFKLLDLKKMGEMALECVSEIGLKIHSANINIEELSGGQRQAVAIASALYHKQRLLILDEPTNNLSIKESRKILEIIKSLKNQNISSIFITHSLHDVYPISDRIYVLKHGKNYGVWKKEDTTIEQITDMITED